MKEKLGDNYLRRLWFVRRRIIYQNSAYCTNNKPFLDQASSNSLVSLPAVTKNKPLIIVEYPYSLAIDFSKSTVGTYHLIRGKYLKIYWTSYC